jgi:hypothetical protein
MHFRRQYEMFEADKSKEAGSGIPTVPHRRNRETRMCPVVPKLPAPAPTFQPQNRQVLNDPTSGVPS